MFTKILHFDNSSKKTKFMKNFQQLFDSLKKLEELEKL